MGKEVTIHPGSNRTCFHLETPAKVKTILERARNEQTLLRIFYGNHETGHDWGEENDMVGRIGRSGGTMKVPLLIEVFSDGGSTCGGGPVLDHCIVRLIDASTGRELYRTAKYQMPVIELVQASEDLKQKGYLVAAMRDGQNIANFKGYEEAAAFQAFIQGSNPMGVLRTREEWREEMREAA